MRPVNSAGFIVSLFGEPRASIWRKENVPGLIVIVLCINFRVARRNRYKRRGGSRRGSSNRNDGRSLRCSCRLRSKKICELLLKRCKLGFKLSYRDRLRLSKRGKNKTKNK